MVDFMASVAAPPRAKTLDEQLQIWQGRLVTALRENQTEDEALLAFVAKSEDRWAEERTYYYELAKLAHRLGARTLDVRNEGAIDTQAEFEQAMVQIVKRLTEDNYVALGQNATAQLVEGQNYEAIAPVRAEETPAFLRSDAEQAELAEESSEADIAAYKQEGERLGYTGESLLLYVTAMTENQRWTSGKGGDPERIAQLLTLARNKIDEGHSSSS
jgi:hypothetical protein